MNKQIYPCDLSDEAWALIEPLIPVYSTGRPRQVDMRGVVNALLYLNRTGCQWRYLPKDYPDWNLVRYYFDCWRESGQFEDFNNELSSIYRQEQQRDENNSAGIIDSQSVKTTEQGGERGFDGGKLINGRKRHILVDTLGLLKKVLVLPAGISDKQGGKALLEKASHKFKRLKHIWADFAYTGLKEWLLGAYKITLEIVKSPKPLTKAKQTKKELLQLYLLTFANEAQELYEEEKGFQVVSWRWIVERTFAWICRNRRLSKDYEKLSSSSEAFIYLAMTSLLVNRLTRAG